MGFHWSLTSVAAKLALIQTVSTKNWNPEHMHVNGSCNVVILIWIASIILINKIPLNKTNYYKRQRIYFYQSTYAFRSCNLVPKPVVLISNRYYIRNITLVDIPRQESLIVQNLTNAVALDFDWQERKLYWSDTTSTQSRIMRMNDDGSFTSREVSVLPFYFMLLFSRETLQTNFKT